MINDGVRYGIYHKVPIGHLKDLPGANGRSLVDVCLLQREVRDHLLESYAVKVTEWKERKRLRTEEVASISKAIEILSSDDAKDTMSSSFKSQGNFFLEVAESSKRKVVEMFRWDCKGGLSKIPI